MMTALDDARLRREIHDRMLAEWDRAKDQRRLYSGLVRFTLRRMTSHELRLVDASKEIRRLDP